MHDKDDVIRSFGMSGYLITEELRDIGNRIGHDLGHTKLDTQRVVDYYPQFERGVRVEASEMARHYELFYCLENAIRTLIIETLQEIYGSDWWNTNAIPDRVKGDVANRIQRDIDSGMTRRSDRAIDYTNFGELSVIITSNWSSFSTIFSSQRAVERVMNNLNLLRGPIAHCCPITEDEIQRLELSVRDWFRMIG